jgi:hypothetical protein
MATIIQLNPPQRAAPPAAAGDMPSRCEIIIFPGVRIERDATPYLDETPDLEPHGGTERGRRPRKTS